MNPKPTEVKHSPLPWLSMKVNLPYEAFEIVDATKNRVGIARLPATRPSDEANAAFIVRACNAHAELLAACKAVFEPNS